MSDALASPLFFALPVPVGVQVMVGRVQDEVLASENPIWIPAQENLHLTLAYLGRLNADKVPDLLDIAKETAGRVPHFALSTSGLSGFPGPGRARVIWLGFVREPVLNALVDGLRAALKAGLVPYDEKPFLAHLTLARFREPVELARVPLSPLEPLRFNVEELRLYQSMATPQGHQYQIIGSTPLADRMRE